MNGKWICIILLMCFSGMPIYSQITADHYMEMCNIVKDSLSIEDAYISDSIHEHETLVFSLYAMGIIKDPPLRNPYEELRSEYSDILHSNFKNIDCMNGYNSNLIYFSFPEDSYVSVYAYLGVRTPNRRYIFPFPKWGYYREWYAFLFQIKDNGVVLLRHQQCYEL